MVIFASLILQEAGVIGTQTYKEADVENGVVEDKDHFGGKRHLDLKSEEAYDENFSKRQQTQ